MNRQPTISAPGSARALLPRCTLLLLAVLAAAPTAALAKGQALVIGNAAYANERALVNTLNDAEDVAAKLRGLGFAVDARENLDARAMRRAVNRFLDAVRAESDTAVIYYSGHGVQDRHRNSYLLPVDARIEAEADIRSEGVSVDAMLDQLAQRPKHAVSLLVLDACRDNPFASKRGGKGIGRVNPPGGTLVLYAASPNQTAEDNPRGRNGLFTKHLLEVLDQPGLDIEDAFDEVALAVDGASRGAQLPYKEGNLLGKHYLAGAAGGGGEADDSLAWKSAQGCGTRACLGAYLQAYPDGKFAGIAAAMLEPSAPAPRPVQPPPADPQTVELALGLSRDERAKVQQALNRLGFAVGSADGVWGANTRAGIQAWQRGAGQPASGYLDGGGYKALLAQAAELEPKPGDSFRDPLRDGGEGPEMVAVPAGCFQMGSPEDEPGRDDNERQHRVCITKPFAIGTTEVTFADYDRFARATGRELPDDEGWGRDRRPVINVSWDDSTAYAEWLSAQTGAAYRLPSEAEWEYAARAGTSTAYWWGDKARRDRANYGKEIIWGGHAEGADRWEYTAPVGSFPANAFGLHDTAGNVWEWVEDWYGDYPSGEITDPVVRQGGSIRVFRGGSWNYTPRHLRSAGRNDYTPGNSNSYLGFRLARSL